MLIIIVLLKPGGIRDIILIAMWLEINESTLKTWFFFLEEQTLELESWETYWYNICKTKVTTFDILKKLYRGLNNNLENGLNIFTKIFTKIFLKKKKIFTKIYTSKKLKYLHHHCRQGPNGHHPLSGGAKHNRDTKQSPHHYTKPKIPNSFTNGANLIDTLKFQWSYKEA